MIETKLRYIIQAESEPVIRNDPNTIVIYNHGHNILRIFDILQSLPFFTREPKPDY